MPYPNSLYECLCSTCQRPCSNHTGRFPPTQSFRPSLSCDIGCSKHTLANHAGPLHFWSLSRYLSSALPRPKEIGTSPYLQIKSQYQLRIQCEAFRRDHNKGVSPIRLFCQHGVSPLRLLVLDRLPDMWRERVISLGKSHFLSR